MDTQVNSAASSAIIGIYRLLLFISIIGCLYYGQYILTPLALAGLFAFLLSPAVSFLERWLGRIISTLFVVILFGLFIGFIGYVITNQVVEFSEKLPSYKANIEKNLSAMNVPQNKSFKNSLETLEELKNKLPGQSLATPNLANHAAPVIQNVSSTDFTSFIKAVFTSIINILGSTGFIFILVIVLLFAREDLRGRFIRLVGPRRISATTRAMSDASNRVTHYLVMQFLFNIIFGFFIAIGLFCLGIPNAILWGGLAAILRFIPFFGAIIATVIPCVLAFAISTTWTTPILTILMFLILDFIIGQIVEPLMSGVATGISTLALILSAVFWTLLWGPVGLLLSTPLTVCIVVMGRHIPKLAFLSVLLGNEEALALYEECYQRLIAIETTEVASLINNHLKTNALVNVFDSVFIPILSAAETDRKNEILDDEQVAFLHQNLQDILLGIKEQKDLIVTPKNNSIESENRSADDNKNLRVLCIPAAHEREELASIMLMEILTRLSYTVDILINYEKNDILNSLADSKFDLVCISLVAPYPIGLARALCTSIRNAHPEVKILLGLWGMVGNNLGIEKKLRSNRADIIVASLSEAVVELEKLSLMKTPLANK